MSMMHIEKMTVIMSQSQVPMPMGGAMHSSDLLMAMAMSSARRSGHFRVSLQPMDKNYWDGIYSAKSENEVSWFQATPARSLELIAELGLASNAKIIDIGGGESHLVDHLLERGFAELSILDISPTALDKTKVRLGKNSKLVKFIASDIRKFEPQEKYQLWHDRATFHFLTNVEDVATYLEIANRAIAPGGYLIVSTFSRTGPEKCSGLTVSQYSDTDLKVLFEKYFTNIKCFEDVHKTPWGTDQNFVYCGFKKR